MLPVSASDLPLPQQLAVAHSSGALKPALAAFLAFDWRLAQFVSKATEPLLAQMRLAWWRDELAKTPENRRQGDPLLTAFGEAWRGEEPVLTGLVDGWEALLAEPPLPRGALEAFLDGRAGGFAALARICGDAGLAHAAGKAGRIWAKGDLIAKLSDQSEKRFVLEQWSEIDKSVGTAGASGGPPALPRKYRSLTILQKLSQRSMAKGGVPLITGRAELMIVSRVGLLGR